jgi:hypothetical protein
MFSVRLNEEEAEFPDSTFTHLPWPFSIQLQFQGSTEESPYHYYDAQNKHLLQRRLNRYGTDNIAGNQELQTQQDSPSQILPVSLVCISPLSPAMDQEIPRSENGSGNDDQHADPIYDCAGIYNEPAVIRQQLHCQDGEATASLRHSSAQRRQAAAQDWQ